MLCSCRSEVVGTQWSFSNVQLAIPSKSTACDLAWPGRHVSNQSFIIMAIPTDNSLQRYDAEGLHSLGAILNETNSGTFTYYIRADDDTNTDRTATFVGNLTVQIEKVCADLASHPILSQFPAINALGLSQGGQFMRAYVQRCNSPPVANLVTFGSQHNGISEFKTCADTDWLCRGWDGLLKRFPWSSFVQSQVVPAQYYRNPEDLENYLAYSNFLADINNERDVKNPTYKANLKTLERFAMYMFRDDVTVIPKQSAWFDEMDGSSGKIIKLRDRRLYREDWLGLRWLDEARRLDFGVFDGKHMELREDVLIDVFKKYFGPRVIDGSRNDDDSITK